MSGKKVQLGLALAALVALGVLASVAAATNSFSSKTEKLTTVKVGLALIPPKMIFIGFYVARDMGFFKRNGLNVDLVGEGDGVKSLRGTVAGSFDMGGTSADDVIAAAAQGGGVTSVWSYAMPLDSTLVVDQNIKTLADLKGKNIGITDPGGFADVQVRAVLAAAGISAKDVHIISLPSRSEFVPAIVSGRINAAPFHIDDGLAAREQDPKLHTLYSIYRALPDWWYGSLAVTDTYKKSHQATIEKFITAMIQADRWMYSHKAQTIAVGVKETQESKAAVTGAYTFLAKANAWTVNAGLQPNRVMSTMRKEHGFKEIPKVPTYSEVADPTYANAVVAKLGKWKKGF